MWCCCALAQPAKILTCRGDHCAALGAFQQCRLAQLFGEVRTAFSLLAFSDMCGPISCMGHLYALQACWML